MKVIIKSLVAMIVGGVVGVFIVMLMNKFSISRNVTETKVPLTVAAPIAASGVDKQGIFNAHMPAPELTGITAWLNPDKPFTLKSLQGNVVLVHFWTNQCINCIHTLPYVTKWYDTYKNQGVVVVGVHTPELAYERTIGSINQAIQTYGIHYPIAQDNNYATWNAYSNQYWPAEYLIDKRGIIRRSYFGEGEYDKTELAIQTLLKE